MPESVTGFISTTTPFGRSRSTCSSFPCFQDGDDLADLSGLDAAVSGDIERARASGEFRGKLYEFFITRVSGAGWKPARVALVGAGRRQELDIERLRRIAAACSYTRAHCGRSTRSRFWCGPRSMSPWRRRTGGRRLVGRRV